MKTMIIIFILVSAAFFSCQEDLPEPSSDGSNTFGCRIEGDVFVPRSGSIKGSSNYAYVANGKCVIRGSNSEGNKFEQVSFGIANFKGKGSYTLNGLPGASSYDFNQNFGTYYYDDYKDDKDEVVYNTTSVLRGSARITHFDAKEKIVSGTFEFRAKLDSTGETVNVTKGRFDLRYRDY